MDEHGASQVKCTTEPEPILDTIEQTARLLNVGRSSVYELINAKQLETVLIGRRSRRVMRSSTKAFVERQKAEGI
jgi:excisionase family DNA binding protein